MPKKKSSKASAHAGKSKKLDFEVAGRQLKQLEHYIEVYNADADRMTRKVRLDDVVNQALATYLQKRLEET